MKIVLIALYNTESLSVRILHPELEKHGHDVSSVFLRDIKHNNMNFPSEKEFSMTLSLIKELKPEVVGISVNSSFFSIAKELIRRIKNELKTIVIIGGLHASLDPYGCLEYADYVCTGECEEALIELFKKIENKKDPTRIQNIWTKRGDKTYQNMLRKLNACLDKYPWTDFSDRNKYYVVNNRVYSNLEALPTDLPYKLRNKGYSIMSSRGCIYKCTFCCNSVMQKLYKDKGRYFRSRSAKNIAAEIGAIKIKKRIKFVFFMEDLFNFQKEWISKFCRYYKNYVDLPFLIQISPNTSYSTYFKNLKIIGLKVIKIGFGSGSNRINKNVYKRSLVSKGTLHLIKKLREEGFKFEYDIISDNPFESWEDKKQTFNLLLKLPKPLILHNYSLIFFPNYPLTKLALVNGMVEESKIEGVVEKVRNNWRVNPFLSRNEEDIFWNCLLSLYDHMFIPKFVLKLMSSDRFLINHPRMLLKVVQLVNLFQPTVLKSKLRYYFQFKFRQKNISPTKLKFYNHFSLR